MPSGSLSSRVTGTTRMGGDRVDRNQVGDRLETLRKWVRRGEIDAGQRPGVTTHESDELRKLKRPRFLPLLSGLRLSVEGRVVGCLARWAGAR